MEAVASCFAGTLPAVVDSVHRFAGSYSEETQSSVAVVAAAVGIAAAEVVAAAAYSGPAEEQGSAFEYFVAGGPSVTFAAW